MNKKVLLMILDGWGKSSDPNASAIAKAKTPYVDSLYKKYPNASLKTDGEEVGLPKGQMGNSEVGHLNLGAGRIVYQELSKINMSIKNNELYNNQTIKEAFAYANSNNQKVHFIGLVSNGGVHSHMNHLFELIQISNEFKCKSFVHAFTDGRDVNPKSAINDIKKLEKFISNKNCEVASVIGRYYSMDRDNRWERIKLAYDLIVRGYGKKVKNIEIGIQQSYDEGITDEFIKPLVKVDENDESIGDIKKGDVVLFFNFRTDRGRQLTKCMTRETFDEFTTKEDKYHFVTMTNYDKSLSGIHIIFENENLKNTLGEVLERNNKTQLRIAETEKYPHVTFFFSGGKEIAFKKEKRILKNSPKVATYDLKPEMSAFEITDALVDEIDLGKNDFICLNYANGDMVGHTGDFNAAIKACEVIDKCVKKAVESCLNNNYTVVLISDHGNCEKMINQDGSPNTAHTKNLVPIILINSTYKSVSNGILANIAPTILKIMGIEIPKEMNVKPLV
jgi:2,3-bisphosphoglycerate-independent phosphoglycerate mutase